MNGTDFTTWLEQTGWTDIEASRRLGCGRNSIRFWKRNGAPLYIGLACSALAMRLPPWRDHEAMDALEIGKALSSAGVGYQRSVTTGYSDEP